MRPVALRSGSNHTLVCGKKGAIAIKIDDGARFPGWLGAVQDTSANHQHR